MKREIAPSASLSLSAPLLQSIYDAPDGLGLAQLLALRPDVSRRTAQRLLAGWVAGGHIVAVGKARARRYVTSAQAANANANKSNSVNRAQGTADYFPTTIPLSADSRDVLDYVDQPLAARKPVGYQRDFLQAYEPNVTWYLPAPLRRQLHNMGHTAQAGEPAGTYSRAILNRLLIDLSWASSQLEGNTYSRLDTRALIEHGQVAHGKAATETQMILNHTTAIELLVESVERQGSESAAGFDRYTLLNLHAALAENLLRDVFVWAYERYTRDTQEYLAIKQDLAEPDPIRLAYRDVIKQTVHAVVMSSGEDAMPLMAQAVAARVPEPDRAAVLSITVDELRRLHEGVLARYGLRPSEFAVWKARAAN